ncbi:hypothetical protein ABO04_03610 [Nitrosomonas sp. HPC101]|uniref:hypothetical protein n=1 Tax=Nitrosomonas sp. HPC101 TaxID=1658667 RepID=UPI00136C8942|nr:hypothetical protein [Nitrosomonas sp. HPC101]MXS85022.1 hypothetical protein [Nitrosomonas sp. HPC101]
MDNSPDILADLEGLILLNKVDSMLRRHRQEQASLIQPVEQQVVTNPPGSMEQSFFRFGELSGELTETQPGIDGIPVLTDQVALTMSINEWSSQTEISELLCFAFDAALREACINLNPAERLTLIHALGKRLPRNL